MHRDPPPGAPQPPTAPTCAGSFPALAGLLVDQASVCAEPQATRLTFLPCRAATSLGLWMALVVPSPSWPSSLSPQVYTSPEGGRRARSYVSSRTAPVDPETRRLLTPRPPACPLSTAPLQTGPRTQASLRRLFAVSVNGDVFAGEAGAARTEGPPTLLGAAHAVQGACGDSDDLLALQPLHLPRPPHVVVGAVAQPMVVPFAPAQDMAQGEATTAPPTPGPAPAPGPHPRARKEVTPTHRAVDATAVSPALGPASRTRCRRCRTWSGRRRTGTHTPPSPRPGPSASRSAGEVTQRPVSVRGGGGAPCPCPAFIPAELPLAKPRPGRQRARSPGRLGRGSPRSPPPTAGTGRLRARVPSWALCSRRCPHGRACRSRRRPRTTRCRHP